MQTDSLKRSSGHTNIDAALLLVRQMDDWEVAIFLEKLAPDFSGYDLEKHLTDAAEQIREDNETPLDRVRREREAA